MKRIIAVFICLACLCLSACCANNNENVLKKIRDANLNSAFQKNGKTVAFRADFYDADSGIDSSYSYLDPNRLV